MTDYERTDHENALKAYRLNIKQQIDLSRAMGLLTGLLLHVEQCKESYPYAKMNFDGTMEVLAEVQDLIGKNMISLEDKNIVK